MPLKQHAKFFAPETLTLMEMALERAWQKLKNHRDVAGVEATRRKLARTIVALAAVGETNPTKLEQIALLAYRGFRVPRDIPQSLHFEYSTELRHIITRSWQRQVHCGCGNWPR